MTRSFKVKTSNFQDIFIENFGSESNPGVKLRIEKIRTWKKDQIDSMNEILSQIDSHYETLNELLTKRQEGLANQVCEHFEKR